MKLYQCARCGGAMRVLSKAGRTRTYRDEGQIEMQIPDDLQLPTCERCDRVFLPPKEMAKLDEALLFETLMSVD